MLISVDAYSESTKLVSWPSHALLPELTVRASVLWKENGKMEKLQNMTKLKKIQKKINYKYNWNTNLKPD